jgi:two-component system KDP operon response regulator KdpE
MEPQQIVGSTHAGEPGGDDGEGADDDAPASRSPSLAPLVLVVEDDRRMRRYLRATLTDQQLRVLETESGAEALAQAAAHNPDMIILDFGIPDIDGIHVTLKLREWTAAPILVLSSRNEEPEKIATLDAGANDYITKPFSTGELLARIRVWLRHTQRARADSLSSVLDVGPLRIDFGNRLAFLEGAEVRLTPTQYKLFATLMRNAGKVMTHEQILFSVWGPAYKRETQYLRVYMGHLRRKFEVDPGRPRFFVTEPGVGYRLRVAR